VRQVLEGGALAALLLLVAGVAAGRWLAAGGPLAGAALLVVSPLLLGLGVWSALRATTILALVSAPVRWLGWRGLLALLVAAIAFLGPPLARRASEPAGERVVVPPTDWIASCMERLARGDRAGAWTLMGSVVLAVAACVTLDVALFVAFALCRHDRLLARAEAVGHAPVGARTLARLLQPRGRGGPTLALLRKDATWLVRDVGLALSFAVPAVVAVATVALLDVLAGGLRLAGLPASLTVSGLAGVASVGAAALGLLVPPLLVTHEGPRLGPLGPWPVDAVALLSAKRRVAWLLSLACLVLAVPPGAWLVAHALAVPWAATCGIGLLGALGVSVPAAGCGVSVGALFARPDTANPLLSVGLMGLVLHGAIAAAAAAAVAGLGLALVHGAWSSLPAPLLLAGLLAVIDAVLAREARRVLREARLGS